jgi:hypothetical protein
MVHWKLFGSNGFIQQPESVIQNFTKRQEYVSKYSINIKTIIRGHKLEKIGIHNSYLSGSTSGTITVDKMITEDILRNNNIHLNHTTQFNH